MEMNRKFIKELKTYPHGKHNDMVDAFSYALLCGMPKCKRSIARRFWVWLHRKWYKIKLIYLRQYASWRQFELWYGRMNDKKSNST